MKKVLITGGTGSLGTSLSRILKDEGFFPHPLGSDALDLRLGDVSSKIMRYGADVIVHAGALTNVDKCEKKPELAFSINTEGTKKIAMAARRMRIPLIYISTDYVFDGKNPPYSEDDVPNPVNVYGESKLRGEKFVEQIPGALILRVSWLFGPDGKDFVDFILDGGDAISVVPHQRSKPTNTIELSKAIVRLIKNKCKGIYHYANPPSVSRLDWVSNVLEIAGRKKDIKKVGWEALGCNAQRPQDTTLSTERYEERFGPINNWKEALQKQLENE